MKNTNILNTHCSLDPTDFIRPALAAITDRRFIAGCPPCWLPAIRETCEAAPEIVSRVVAKTLSVRSVPSSHFEKLQHYRIIQNEVNTGIAIYFVASQRRHDPQLDKRFWDRHLWETAQYKRAIRNPHVTEIPCELCCHPALVQRKRGATVRCHYCGLMLRVVTENRKWRLAYAEEGTARMPNLKESYDILGIHIGASLEEVQAAFGSSFRAYHPQWFQEATARIQDLAETTIRMFTHAARQIEANIQATHDAVHGDSRSMSQP